MAGPIRIDVETNARTAGRDVDTLSTKTSQLGTRLRSVGKGIALGLGAGLLGAAAAGAKFAQAAIEDQQAAARMAQTFKTAAGATKQQIAATEDWITAQGKALGVADDDLRPALARLVTATGDVEKAQRLASLAMDVSAGTGKSLEQVSTALMKAQNGQVSALSRLGIQTKNAAGDTISMEEATRRMADTFGGAAQANADTLGGRVARLKLVGAELGEELGARMLPYLTTFANFLLERGVPAVVAVGSRIAEWVGTMRERLAPALTEVGGFITGTVVPGVARLTEFLVENQDVLVAVAAGVLAAKVALVTYTVVTKGVAAATAAWNVIQKVLNGTMRANPIGLVVTAIGLLVAGLVLAYNRSDSFREIVQKVAGVMVDWKDKALSAIGSYSSGGGGILGKVWSLVDAFGGMRETITTKASGMWDGLKDSFRSAINSIIGWWNNLSFSLDIPDKIPGLPDSFTISTPNIPMLANGGIVTRPTLAVIGEAGPEAVIPLNRLGVGGGTLKVQIELTAEQMHQLERGRRAFLDISAYQAAGGI